MEGLDTPGSCAAGQPGCGLAEVVRGAFHREDNMVLPDSICRAAHCDNWAVQNEALCDYHMDRREDGLPVPLKKGIYSAARAIAKAAEEGRR